MKDAILAQNHSQMFHEVPDLLPSASCPETQSLSMGSDSEGGRDDGRYWEGNETVRPSNVEIVE